MPSRSVLSEDEWSQILAYLRQHPKVRVGSQHRCRRFVEAVLWILRTGAQWRELPPARGKWNSVFKRFNRWSQRAVWIGLLDYVQDGAELRLALIDSTVVRAHAGAAGGTKKTSTAQEGLGRSRGGFSSKIHAVTDAQGRPLVLDITPG